jgi:hypothetical protein
MASFNNILKKWYVEGYIGLAKVITSEMVL